ncbi:MAG: helix-turn-helix transcriptional regulator [Clostridia bacterium]
MEENIYINDFALRLSTLRQKKNVTARDMSLSLGQSHNFINNIELGKNFPTMLNFFYICEFLEISPIEFFDYKNKSPLEINNIVENLTKLSSTQLSNISDIVEDLCRGK